MRRWLVRILVCLLLGVVTTVGVAWACAAWSAVGHTVTEPFEGLTTTMTGPNTTVLVTRESSDQSPSSFDACLQYDGIGLTRLFWIQRVEQVPQARGIVFVRLSTGGRVLFDLRFRSIPEVAEANPFTWSKTGEGPVVARSSASTFIIEDGAGWPARALASFSENSTASGWNRSTTTDAIFLEANLTGNTRYGTYRALPLRPIWLGFLLDMLFYAVIWVCVFFALRATRQTLRTRRGLCPMCGYDLRGDFDAGCPECGWNRAEDEA